ncbi:MAG: zinc-dependent alcohol dehydrogenase family protein [Planctomycetales bacterium]
MRAIVFDRCGEPADVLSARDVPLPQPGAGQVRVRMLAAPINPSDLMSIRGTYGMLPALPATPGFEGVGIVDAAGPGWLGRLLIGRRVAALQGQPGSWGEHALVSARQAIPLSSRLPLEQGAMFFVNPATAFVMTQRVLKVSPGAWLLQSAAGSALGRMVIRLGKRFGFRTINVVRRDDQRDELLALGADHVVVAEGLGCVDQVRELTGGVGVGYAIDCVGGDTGSAMLCSLAWGGRMLSYGTLSGAPLSISPRELMTRQASLSGFWLGHWMSQQNLPGKIRLIRTLTKLILEGTLASPVGETFPLEEIAAAVRHAEQTGRTAKTLLRIARS